jgi:Carboxypeptidase regulatory-like domain
MKRCLVALAAAVCLSSSLFAQFDSASVLGVVRDGTGAVVPGTLVTLTNLDTGIHAEVNTTSSGEFEFASSFHVLVLEINSHGSCNLHGSGAKLPRRRGEGSLSAGITRQMFK